ncbi:MAG: class I SAM-dependent methyltransferase [Polyangia bacterium]
MKFRFPPSGVLVPNSEFDPLPYYYRPVVGHIYRHRLQMGLRLIPRGGQRVLEIGVGSGILVPSLTAGFPEYVGTDLLLAPGLESLVTPGCHATFRVADLLDANAVPPGDFDVVVCLSVLEHIADAEAAARCLARTLAPGGTLVTGYPMVNRFMATCFRTLGFGRIEEHHVTTPAQITTALGRLLRPVGRVSLPMFAPQSLSLYECTSWTNS